MFHVNSKCPQRNSCAESLKLLTGAHVHVHRKGSPQTSDRIPNADLPTDAVNLGVGGLQVHGTGSRRLVYKEVLEL